MNGSIPPALTPRYPWGQGSPSRMTDPAAKQGVYEMPPTSDGSGAGVVVAGLLAAAILWFTLRGVKR